MGGDPIFLRPLTQADADTIFTFTSNPEVAKYMRFDQHRTVEEAAELLRNYMDIQNYGFMICLRETEQPIGVAALMQEKVRNCFSVSMYSAPEYWGNGYCSKGLEQLIALGRGLELVQFTAHIVGDNQASRRMVEKVGFRLEKVLHFDDLPSGLYVYSYRF